MGKTKKYTFIKNNVSLYIYANQLNLDYNE